VDSGPIAWSCWSGNWPLHPVELVWGAERVGSTVRLSVCLEIFPAVCTEMEPPHPGERQKGCPLPHRSSLALVPVGIRRLWFLEVPEGSGLGSAPGPLSVWLLPASLRGTVNPFNGLGGNSCSPPLNGSSDAACGALEVAELRPYSGPNHPPTPSQNNNNNPSDILAAGGTQAAFVLSRSGDPLLVQQQCPFVRPACWTGTVNGRFC